MATLVQRDQQEDVAWALDEPDVQMAVENSSPNRGGISSLEYPRQSWSSPARWLR